MKSTTLTVFSVLMVVCLTTAMSTGKARSNEELHKLIADLLENFNALDKRGGGICDDPFMDVMSFKSSNYCRRKRREALTEQ